ncbi:Mediator of RNA polymerase II transcription subunit 7 [Halotydeus destructor]|nr:Mediator of RNA polymerase II transcription subunit 7 [Halotydeus destructor]
MMSGATTPPHSLSGGSGPSTPTGSGPNAFGAGQSNNNQPSTASAFPDPPNQYIRFYSDDHLARSACPEPPKPVTDGQYSLFGVAIICDDSIIRPLEAQGIRRLYPRDYDHKKELRKMNASILVNFLDLLDIVVKCPDTPKREEKCADINMLFIQMHHLINELRPHQARETIRVTMQCQKRTRQEIILRLNKQIEKVSDLIAGYISGLPDIHDTTQGIEDLIKLNEFKFSEESSSDDANDDILKMVELDSIMCNVVDESQL